MPLEPMPASVRPEVQRVVAAARELAVDARSGPARRSPCRRCTMRSAGRPSSSACAADSSAETISASRITSSASSGAARARVLVHQAREQLLVEAAPVDADAHRLAVARCAASIMVANCSSRFAPLPTLPGLMRYLASARAQSGYCAEQLVAVEVEIADQRHAAAHRVEPRADARPPARPPPACSTVMRTSSEPARDSSNTWRAVAARVGGIGVGHRLHHDRRAAADGDARRPGPGVEILRPAHGRISRA